MDNVGIPKSSASGALPVILIYGYYTDGSESNFSDETILSIW